MAANSRKKKLLLSAGSLLAAAALGAGIWFGTRGRGEPVNVYPFEFIGMTEFWGDAQESYGPVTTDKIQTEFLSDTQTVTEVPVKKGDTVKKGDILFSFDTTLDALSLERKRLEVEKVKVQIKAAEERLGYVRQLVPYTPVAPEIPKEDLGDKWEESEMISDNTAFDGSKPERALICWLNEGMVISNDILEDLYGTASAYQQNNTTNEDSEESVEDEPESNASAIPDTENPLNLLFNAEKTSALPEPPKITIYPVYDGIALETFDISLQEITENGKNVNKYIVPDVHKFLDGEEKTCWFLSATRKSDDVELTELVISECPETGDARDKWEALWGEGIKVNYTRKVSFTGKVMQDNRLVPIEEGKTVGLKIDQEAIVVISSHINNLKKETEVSYSVSPQNGIFEAISDGNLLCLVGTPEAKVSSEKYTVTARYEFKDNLGQSWRVDEKYTFTVSVDAQNQKDEFYVVFKYTEDNVKNGVPLVWQGAKVTVYENDTFDMVLYDASGFPDHTLETENEIEIDLPEIRPNEIYTAEQIVDMQKQLYATIKEQTEKLVVVEKEYDVMRRELGDGNVYAEIDGKVMSVLTEEEAREEKQPLVKVSGGGGFYIEGSVSELEKASLKIGQEVTVNDWNSGNTYTGEVVSISDFPAENDNWNGIGNPTASYYPYKAFVGEEADLEAGSHVSMSYSASAAENGIYLEKAFVRTEKGESYIYVRGADGKLEKRTVQVGKVLWGSYYEILSDLSEEDYLAFPYGKDVKQGAPTVESDLSVLYTY